VKKIEIGSVLVLIERYIGVRLVLKVVAQKDAAGRVGGTDSQESTLIKIRLWRPPFKGVTMKRNMAAGTTKARHASID
jgi:hypothetical protein